MSRSQTAVQRAQAWRGWLPAALLVAALAAGSPARTARAERGQTQVARGDQVEPGLTGEPAAEEPALAGGEPSGALRWTRSFWARRPRGPTLKLGYRAFWLGEMGGRTARYDSGTLDVYILSRLLRAGAGLEVGLDDSPRKNFVVMGTLLAGLQYPMGLTPFVDCVVAFGVLRRDILHRDLYSFTYAVGLEAGLELFMLRRLLLSVALGWRHPVIRHQGNEEVEPADVYYDTFTIKVALGF